MSDVKKSYRELTDDEADKASGGEGAVYEPGGIDPVKDPDFTVNSPGLSGGAVYGQSGNGMLCDWCFRPIVGTAYMVGKSSVCEACYNGHVDPESNKDGP